MAGQYDDKPKRYERRAKTSEQALSSLMQLASRSEKSSGDALRLMRGWGVEPEQQAKVLKTLTDQKFIDDIRYAEAYVREKSRLNGWGSYKIQRMLSAKGIEKSVIDHAMRQLDPDTVKNKLGEMMERKMKTIKTSDTYQLKGKLMRYGLSLGYGYEEVMETVEKIIKNMVQL